MHLSSTVTYPGLHTHLLVKSMNCYILPSPHEVADISMHTPVGVRVLGGGQTQLLAKSSMYPFLHTQKPRLSLSLEF